MSFFLPLGGPRSKAWKQGLSNLKEKVLFVFGGIVVPKSAAPDRNIRRNNS